jgi:hypothetical protein
MIGEVVAFLRGTRRARHAACPAQKSRRRPPRLRYPAADVSPRDASNPRLPSPHPSLLVAFVLLPMSLIGVGIAGFFAARTLSLVEGGESAPGVIVELRRSSKGGTRPVVEFTPKGRAAIRVEGGVSSTPPAYEIGERVQVHYDPDDPERMVIDGFLEMWFVPTLVGGLAGAELLAAAVSAIVGLGRRLARNRLRRQGWRAAGSVVSAVPVRGKKRHQYDPVIEAPDPTTGAPTRYLADRMASAPAAGRPATVYVDPHAPHAYFVELG